MLESAKAEVSRAASRGTIAQMLAGFGAPTTAPVLDLLEQLDGVSVRGMEIGLAHVRSMSRKLPASIRALAVPVGSGPSDATFWVDASGVVYDDTDLERIVPVGRGAEGLLAYWLEHANGSRWSGAVHDFIVRVGDLSPEAIAQHVGPVDDDAVGAGLSLWPPSSSAVCDAIDVARPVFDVGTTLSTNDRAVFVRALRALSTAHPDIRIRLDVPSPPWYPPAAGADVERRIRAFDMYREDRDG